MTRNPQKTAARRFRRFRAQARFTTRGRAVDNYVNMTHNETYETYVTIYINSLYVGIVGNGGGFVAGGGLSP